MINNINKYYLIISQCMEQVSSIPFNSNMKVKTKTKTKKVLVDKIMETLSELKTDFLELKKIK